MLMIVQRSAEAISLAGVDWRAYATRIQNPGGAGRGGDGASVPR